MAIVGVLTTILSGNNAPLLASLAQSEAAMKGYASGTTAATGLAKTALLGMGVAAAVGVVIAVKAAADFEDAMTGVRKTVDEADLAAAGLTFEGLGMQFRQMATEIPVAATELAAIGETAGALGIKAADIENFTRTVALLGSTTDLSTGVAAESLGKIGTILGLTGQGFENFADILVNLGNKGASTESEIIEVTKRFASAGLQAGLGVPEILAFSSAIASAGVEPEAAGSALSRMFGNMVLGAAKGTDAGKAFAKTTGMAFGDFSDLVKTDTVGAMLLVLDSLNDLDQFGQIRALDEMGIKGVNLTNAIRVLAGTYETNLIPALDNARNAQGALATEAEKRFQSFNVQLTLLGNNLTELGIAFGTPLLPALTAGVQGLSGALSSGLASGILPAIAGMGALALAVLAVNAAVGALALILSPVAVVIAGIAASAIAIQGFLNKNNAIAAANPSMTSAEIAAQKYNQGSDAYRTAAQKHGYMPGTNPQSGLPLGSFNTPGFHAGEAASPFFGPMTPVGGFGGRSPEERQAINYTANLIVDGDKIATLVERRLYNDSSTWSSGFITDRTPIR